MVTTDNDAAEAPHDDGGVVPLSLAPLKFGDKAAVAQYRKLRTKMRVGLDAKKRWDAACRSNGQPSESDKEEYLNGLAAGRWATLNLLDPLRAETLARLQAGELVAEGIPVPMSHTAERVRIAPLAWNELIPDFRKSTASGGGCDLTQIVVQLADIRPGSAKQRAKPASKRHAEWIQIATQIAADDVAATKPINVSHIATKVARRSKCAVKPTGQPIDTGTIRVFLSRHRREWDLNAPK